MALIRCPLCGGELVRKTEESELGKHDYDECLSCGERYYFEDMIDAIDRAKTEYYFVSTSTRTDGNWYPLTVG